MSFLNKIAEKKKERLEYAKSSIHLRDLKLQVPDIEKPRDFKAAITRGQRSIRLIAEIKKASPSRGIIRPGFDLVDIARAYEGHGVDAVSVITEEDFFSGRLDFIPTVKKTVTKPVLRKDFIIDEYQIYESRVFGADAVLLIASLLEKMQTQEYLDLCRELGLSVIFEVHDLDELEKALWVGAETIGINNRNLKTLAVDLEATFLIKRAIPSGRITVSESGIRTRGDVMRLENAGIDAMLIGTSFMESKDIGKKIDELRGS